MNTRSMPRAGLLTLVALGLMASVATVQTARAQAQAHDTHAAHGGSAASAADSAGAPAAPLVDAEVRKVDPAQGRLTLRHGPLPQLNMPPMTMVFRVAEPALLDGLKAGDAVRVAIERRSGGLTVTRIEPAAR